MRQKSDIEMEQQRILKIKRTMVRLKYSLLADEELNAVLPATLAEFNKALETGELKQLHANLNDVLGEL